jgi:hypothetical protein
MLSSTVRLAVVSMSLLRQGYGMPCFQVSNAPTMPRLMRTRHASQSVALCASSTLWWYWTRVPESQSRFDVRGYVVMARLLPIVSI